MACSRSFVSLSFAFLLVNTGGCGSDPNDPDMMKPSSGGSASGGETSVGGSPSGGAPSSSGGQFSTGGTPATGGAASGGEASGGAQAGGGAASGGGGAAAGDGGTTNTGGVVLGSGGDGTGGAAVGGSEMGSGGQPSTGGAPNGGGDCNPNPSGTFVDQGDVVLDEVTCLTWMKADVAGDPYFEAEAFCDALSLGGYDDWRLPTAGEVTTLFHCEGTYPPVHEVFTVGGDGIWTTTESGTIAGDEPKVCGAGQNSGQFYDFGKVGGQNTRCVRGSSSLSDRTDCKTNTQICP